MECHMSGVLFPLLMWVDEPEVKTTSFQGSSTLSFASSPIQQSHHGFGPLLSGLHGTKRPRNKGTHSEYQWRWIKIDDASPKHCMWYSGVFKTTTSCVSDCLEISCFSSGKKTQQQNGELEIDRFVNRFRQQPWSENPPVQIGPEESFDLDEPFACPWLVGFFHGRDNSGISLESP